MLDFIHCPKWQVTILPAQHGVTGVLRSHWCLRCRVWPPWRLLGSKPLPNVRIPDDSANHPLGVNRPQQKRAHIVHAGHEAERSQRFYLSQLETGDNHQMPIHVAVTAPWRWPALTHTPRQWQWVMCSWRLSTRCDVESNTPDTHEQIQFVLKSIKSKNR